MEQPEPFSPSPWKAGMIDGLKLAVGLLAYGAAYGVLARQAGLSWVEAMGMSGIVFAGASQYIALELWTPGNLPVLGLTLTVLLVNLRHVLMGAAVAPCLKGLSRGRQALTLFFLIDESFALTIGSSQPLHRKAAYLLASGMTLYACWNLSTLAGILLIPEVADPAAYGLDFLFCAAFLALLAAMYSTPRDAAPWVVAAVAAALAEQLLPGKWYMVLGGVAGGLAGALAYQPPKGDG